jgi:pyruvate,water dikinase
LIRGHFDPEAAQPGTSSGTDIKGFPGAAGIDEGTARVVSTVDEAESLRRGEILVTTITNIGWTPLFPRAAAVVTDVGAPLSHAAIVARELGIPAVVGCGNATARLSTGDRIRVDGAAGTVVLLD